MIIAKDIKQIFKNEKYRSDILKEIHIMNSKVQFDKGKLELRYTDKSGNQYYGFPQDYELPLERFGKLKYYLSWMVQGISPDEQNTILDLMDKSLFNGLKDTKNAAMIGKCIEELRMREHLTIHTELLYNFLSVQWVRQDENPLVFNNQIQLEKVEAFKKENADGNTYFFFQQKELKMLSNLFKMSEQEWNQYWQESLLKQEYMKELMKKLSSLNTGKEK